MAFLLQRAQTALHAAVENGHSDVVEALLIAGVDIAATERVGSSYIPVV
jgi:ankyrin repeat protein